jgi:hypothetical protein
MHTVADKKTIFRKDNQVREEMDDALLWKGGQRDRLNAATGLNLIAQGHG